MRTFALLVALLVAFGGLAGCVGNKDTPPTVTTPPGGAGGNDGNPPAGKQITVLAPLVSSLSVNGPMWVVSGTDVPVSLTMPTNAKGTLTYAWATGPLAGTAAVTTVVADTGSKSGSEYIPAGSTKSITFGVAGIYAMHCHPHPYMRSNVTVIDGYAGPKEVTVDIVDGDSPATYRFVPENIAVGVGTVVKYHNAGTQPHTATTLIAQSPPLKLQPLAKENGTVKFDTNANGWMNIVAVIQDSEGHIGFANKSIYVTPKLPAFKTLTAPFTFTYGASTLDPTPAKAEPKSQALVFELPAKFTINYTFVDGAAKANPALPNNAAVVIHLTKDGETQDTATDGPAPSGSITGKAIAGAYTLKVVPVGGANLEGTVVIDAVYDLVPPAPTMPPAFDESKPHVH